eukprot:gene37377-38721_t
MAWATVAGAPLLEDEYLALAFDGADGPPVKLRPGGGAAARGTIVDGTDGQQKNQTLADLLMANAPRHQFPDRYGRKGSMAGAVPLSPVASGFEGDQWQDPWTRGGDPESWNWAEMLKQADTLPSPLCTPGTVQALREMAEKGKDDACGGARAEMQEQARQLLVFLDGAFSPEEGFDRRRPGFGDRLAKDIDALASEVQRLHRNQPKLVDVKAPCFVFGDIHGNYGDLTDLCNKLCLFGEMRYTPFSFVFLGDYVDRGMWGPEVVLYVLALKVLAPNEVVLLRGNHEDPDINGDQGGYGTGSFLWQCVDLWGHDKGQRLFDGANACFGTMPLAACIEGKIFACHGGLPRHDGGGDDDRVAVLRDPAFPSFPRLILPEGYADPDALAQVPGPLPVPAHAPFHVKCQVYAHDLAWADPSTDADLIDDSGFGQSDRGAGVPCYGQRAVHGFLERNGYDLIIRGHEARGDGLQVSKQASVLTVFTSSDYCNSGRPGGVRPSTCWTADSAVGTPTPDEPAALSCTEGWWSSWSPSPLRHNVFRSPSWA